MAHYAELGIDNIVKRCLYITTKDCMTEGGIEKEEIGRTHLETHHGGTWVKYSYNTTEGVHLQGKTPFRAHAPSPGWYYDSTHDIDADGKVNIFDLIHIIHRESGENAYFICN